MKKLAFQWAFRELEFKFEAGTSRGKLKTKPSFFVKLFEADQPEVYGLGEAGLIPGLSPDYHPDYAKDFLSDCWAFCQGKAVRSAAARMALETAYRDLNLGGKRVVFDNSFAKGQSIAINGLIWMGNYQEMKEQIDQKIAQGFDCLKLKVGAIDFESELRLLRYIRETYDPKISLRVDANGAFAPREALSKLKQLAEFGLHSIEQPIAALQERDLQQLCRLSEVAVALDEELFAQPIADKYHWLSQIRPSYIVLKPSLLGGIDETLQWIEAAQKLQIGYWLTSALESNIGLNAIAQLAAQKPQPIPQGLGTGSLFTNNFDSPLLVSSGHIRYQTEKDWLIDLQWQ
jgi:L-alanine-DL-glutamate epimerase-like enolase superfamily enzyme